MPDLVHTFLAALATTLTVLALVFRAALRWLTPHTALSLVAAAAALNLVRALDRSAWAWACLHAAATAWLAYWAVRERPARTGAQP